MEPVTATQESVSINSVLVANRGEVAVRIIRTLKKMNIRSIAIYSDADEHAPHARLADQAYPLHGNAAQDTYTNI